MATSIDWRAFWVSLATIIIALIIFETLLKPLIVKFKVQIVQEEETPVKAAA